jgi:hypothetical protein
MRVRPVIARLVAFLCLLPAAARAESSAAVPAFTFTAGRADFADDGRIPHGVVGGGVEWVATRHIALGPEVLYMVGPGEDRDLFVLGVARIGILPLHSRVAPFITGGAGMMTHSNRYGGRPFSSVEGAFVVGGGVRINATPHVYIAPELTMGWEPHLRFSATIGVRIP